MNTSKLLRKQGDYLEISIDDNDQTASIGLIGTFSGVLRLKGQIGVQGQEIEITAYKPDGTPGSVNDPVPNNLFVEVGGYTKVRVIAEEFASGELRVSGYTTSAVRPKNSSGSGTGSEVQVTNFPIVQPVSGPLTDQELRAAAVPVSLEDHAKESTLKQVRDVVVGFDSLGAPLPTDFDSSETTFVNDPVREVVLSMTKVTSEGTYTKTLTYDENNMVTNISKWVKS